MNNSTGDTAAGYADALGLHVFPVDPETKRPHRMLGGRGGLHHATRDPTWIREWWTTDPHARIGVNLGASRLAAFDFEGPEKGGDPDACRDAIRTAFSGDGLPVTWETVTPSGGRHVLYRVPERVTVKGGKLPVQGPGLDVLRADGLYVIVPAVVPDPACDGWRDMDGRRWAVFPARDPAPLPEWVIEARTPRPRPKVKRDCVVCPDEGDATRYGRKALEGISRELAGAPEGERHTTAVRVCRRAYGLADEGQVTPAVVRRTVLHAAQRAGLSEAEAVAVVDWCEGVAA